MIDKNGVRQLAYVVKIDDIKPIEGKDRVECAVIGGWSVMVRKGELSAGDYAVYFEIDSKVPADAPFDFLKAKHYKIKTQRYKTPSGAFFSQGLVMPFKDFVINDETPDWLLDLEKMNAAGKDIEHYFLTDALGVTYSSAEDRERKSQMSPTLMLLKTRHPKVFKNKIIKWLLKKEISQKFVLWVFRKRDSERSFPSGKFEGVAVTDQERCENMTWVLQDKTPFIVTQKCDGSSATYILERRPHGKFKFWVCSRRVNLKRDDETYHGHNYYWDAADLYDIQNKMKSYLKEHPKTTFVCWQGELCNPNIQGNPHKLTRTHLYCFHWTDSENGRLDIREAKKLWDKYGMETVPIVGTVVLPDDFEEFKLSADGFYDPIVCEGAAKQKREGFVYYKTTDPAFSFKNVSRNYLLSKKN